MRTRPLLVLIVAAMLAGWFSSNAARAQAPVEPLHIVLVVDDSGSMVDNDGQNLRLVAAKLLISLLEAQDQVAVVRFSTESQVVAPFTAMDPGSKRELIAQLDERFRSEGGTDIRAALVEARALMARAPVGRGYVVLMTDGLPYIAAWKSQKPTPEELKAYVEETLAVAGEIGVPVLTVALGSEVDRALLGAISQATLGRSFEAATALDLPAIYLEVLSQLQDRTVVGPGPLAAPGQAAIDVHPYARSVGFVVVKDPQVSAALYPPGAGRPLDVRPPAVAFHEPQFDVVIVPDLPAGSWRVELSGAGQANVKAIVIRSRLQLDLSSPAGGAACAGQPWLIGARLSLAGRDGELVPIRGADAPAHLSAQVTLPDGRVETLALRDETGTGEFTAFFDQTGQPGTYQIVLQTSAGGLETRRSAQVAAQACPGLAVVAPRDGEGLDLDPGQPIPVEVHLAGGGGVPLDKGGVSAVVTDATGNQAILRLTDAGQGQHRGEFTPRSAGEIVFQARLEDAVWQGLPVQAEAKPVRVTVTIIPPDPWARYRAWGWIAAAALIVLSVLLVRRWMRQPRLDGELIYGRPGERPDYEPVRGRAVYLQVEDGYLAVRRSRRGAQAMLRAVHHDGVCLQRLDSAPLAKNNVPVGPEGSLAGPQDVIRLAGIEIRYQSYREE